MKPKFIMISLVFPLLLGFTEASGSSLVTAPLVVNDPKWPPFFYGGKQPQAPGFGKEILSSCLDSIDVPYKYRFFPIARNRVGMQQGTVDLNIYSFKPSREEFLHFGKEPLFELSYHPVSLKEQEVKIKRIEDFDQYRLGHQIGFRYSDEFLEYVNQRREKGTLDETNSNISNFRKLLQKRIDVFVSTTASIGSVSKDMGIQGEIEVLPFLIRRSPYYVAISRKSPRIKQPQLLLEKIDQCIHQLKSNKSYCQVAKSYGVVFSPDDQSSLCSY
ncbi:substrate-binding periplasmic protein [Pseudobacteriovorax antillogorgiicola]|uniref:Polar amino acid transport system substrate-binding protein n=1 Tax=Pseudobacteriovorax antillogorgiicola TaxID=1513793 RepID=A0A1Y6C8Q2_9BACT|nr:transporter substrate-binding domain-containing protein [Pseudobacteriovorax antillogorgiicola]TCS49099.1 polar amino acid transport system substrate-binding protein [Pseudobacteriovorax antillogorgiicola]SMF51747.1 polar amino acid transport system substrate-binding protein [Pseudobacteriovorax antillogorgiicola]